MGGEGLSSKICSKIFSLSLSQQKPHPNNQIDPITRIFDIIRHRIRYSNSIAEMGNWKGGAKCERDEEKC